jgi:hypothetical protein
MCLILIWSPFYKLIRTAFSYCWFHPKLDYGWSISKYCEQIKTAAGTQAFLDTEEVRWEKQRKKSNRL